MLSNFSSKQQSQFSNNTREPFDLRHYIDRLTPTKKKGKYICPVCGGNDFSLDNKSGKYQCWHGCENADIREAVAPWDEVKGQRRQPTKFIRNRKKSAPNPPPLPEVIELAMLPAPIAPPDKVRKGNKMTTRYTYSSRQWIEKVEAFDTQGNRTGKQFYYKHVTPEGKIKNGKGNQPWTAYRLSEALAHCQGKAVLLVEGEQDADTLCSLGVVAISLRCERDLETTIRALKEAGAVALITCTDNDQTGQKKAKKYQEEANRQQFPGLVLNLVEFWTECPDKGDLTDFVKAHPSMNQEDFIERLEAAIHAAVEARSSPNKSSSESNESSSESHTSAPEPEIPDSFVPNFEYTQQTFNYLYGDKPWICVEGKLYYWTGTYYKHSKDVIEIKRIRNFLNSFAVAKKGEITYPYAKPSSVKNALEWVKMSVAINPDETNPPGINCTNGVLKIHWLGTTPAWQLKAHTPAEYYLYEPVAKYDPKADPTACNQLLASLDSEQQAVFLRTVAASLDLQTVRRYKGRLVRAVLLKGLGSNGKDTLREVVKLMYGGIGMTGCTLTDFNQYDQGRKFPLAKLARSRVNWASENASFNKLDSIQSLKAAITGDTLTNERKGVDEDEYEPLSVFLFNCNDVPRLQGTLEAIESRYAVLSFNKTFKIKADPTKGEIEADPRFKYDPDFLRDRVLPAFLNRVLGEFTNLMEQGIDYSCTAKAMQDIQAENSHLMRFCRDTGLDYLAGSEVTAKAIWERLQPWYEADGTLTYEESSTGKQKAIWADQPKKFDKNVKAPNQVVSRFLELFPKAKRGKNAQNQIVLVGIGFTEGKLKANLRQSEGNEGNFKTALNADTAKDTANMTEGTEGTEGNFNKPENLESNSPQIPAPIPPDQLENSPPKIEEETNLGDLPSVASQEQAEIQTEPEIEAVPDLPSTAFDLASELPSTALDAQACADNKPYRRITEPYQPPAPITVEEAISFLTTDWCNYVELAMVHETRAAELRSVLLQATEQGLCQRSECGDSFKLNSK